MATVSVADLLRAGRIETIPPDVIAAWSRIDEANAHLVSSAALAKSDPALAHVALYDAARKAITAHMQAWLAADHPNWGAPGGRVVRRGGPGWRCQLARRAGIRSDAPDSQSQRVQPTTNH